MSLAPITLFVYNRPLHTEQTIEALQKNELAGKSHLIIYSDAPKNEDSLFQVKEVRDYLKTIKGFKTITIIEREKNWGLALNIIDGVTEVVNEFGKVIVMEDDIITSPAFLSFMNKALDFYENEKKVCHISGWNYPIDSKGLGDYYFWRCMNCWGWATWNDRWIHFEKNPKKLIKNFSFNDIKSFDLEHSGIFWNQVVENYRGTLNTWAVFWYASIFVKKGLCLNPTVSLVKNSGFDGSGQNCFDEKDYGEILSTKEIDFQNIGLIENRIAVKRITRYLNERNGKKIKRLLIYLRNLTRNIFSLFLKF